MDRFVQGMALVRILSSVIELSAALLMLYFGRVDSALRINAALGLVGPTILMVVSLIGIAGLAGRISYTKLFMILAGIFLIFRATR